MIFTHDNDDKYYEALVNKDSTFEGIFICGVKTTGIFCRPTCHARKPKRENVEFFEDVRSALRAGYRPCKVCHPMESYGVFPDWLEPIMERVLNTPGIRLKDYEIRQMDIDPNRLRRWFKKHYSMTFQEYLRLLRLGEAIGQIKLGQSVSGSAFDSGYESLSGFTDGVKKNFGDSPSKIADKQLIVLNRLHTPLGPMVAGATPEGICLLEFVDRRMLETQLKRLKKYLKADIVPGRSPYFEPLQVQLNEYFSGTRKNFDIPLVLPGTEFQKQVWEELQSIPYGDVRTYKEQADHIGNPGAIRAVGKANGDNRIGIIIPCHRVIGSDGSLVGYGGGLERKEYLLKLERENSI